MTLSRKMSKDWSLFSHIWVSFHICGSLFTGETYSGKRVQRWHREERCQRIEVSFHIFGSLFTYDGFFSQVKRILGRGFSDDTVKKDVKGFPFKITDKDGIKPCVCLCVWGGCVWVFVCVFLCVCEREWGCVWRKMSKDFHLELLARTVLSPLYVWERERAGACERERESVCVGLCVCDCEVCVKKDVNGFPLRVTDKDSVYVRTRAHMCIWSHTHTPSYTHVNTHTHTHKRTHTRTHTSIFLTAFDWCFWCVCVCVCVCVWGFSQCLYMCAGLFPHVWISFHTFRSLITYLCLFAHIQVSFHVFFWCRVGMVRMCLSTSDRCMRTMNSHL